MVATNPQNTRGRRAIRFRELNNRLRQKVYGGDLKKKKKSPPSIFPELILILSSQIRVRHKRLPDGPGQVKVGVGQAFLNTNKNYLPESGKQKFPKLT